MKHLKELQNNLTGVSSWNSAFVLYGIPMARRLWIEFPGTECMIARPDPLLAPECMIARPDPLLALYLSNV